MAYRMTEISDRVRVGKTGSGDLDVDVYETPKGWTSGEEPTGVLIPSDAVDELFEYLRRN